VRLLANPIVLRMLLVFVATASAFALGAFLIRRMRRTLDTDSSLTPDAPSAEALPLHAYNAVIQELKQQKHELQSEQVVERRRAKTSESINAAVLSNLSSGVMFLTPDGLVRQANASAKRILGFASPVGVRVSEIFREAAAVPSSAEPGQNIAGAIESGLREKAPFLRMTAQYTSPVGTQRLLEITVTAVHAPGGEGLGAACLINDQSDLAQMRRQQELQREMAAEMALGLRNSLTTISGYAQQIATSHDPQVSQRLAEDIAEEAAQVSRTIGGFLIGDRAMSAAAGS
jgi:nitrogen fixation/metabolism regulation signal transduction histidine kinase